MLTDTFLTSAECLSGEFRCAQSGCITEAEACNLAVHCAVSPDDEFVCAGQFSWYMLNMQGSTKMVKPARNAPEKFRPWKTLED